ELRFREANLLHEGGRLPEAVQAYRAFLENADSDDHFSSLDRGMRTFKARQNLAIAYTDQGDLPRAEEQWRLGVQEGPRLRVGGRGLGEVLLSQGKQAEALALADRLMADGPLRGEGLVLRARLAAAAGDVEGARRQLDQALQECPNDLEPLRCLCQLLFAH